MSCPPKTRELNRFDGAQGPRHPAGASPLPTVTGAFRVRKKDHRRCIETIKSAMDFIEDEGECTRGPFGPSRMAHTA
jgi:hypothetical protein